MKEYIICKSINCEYDRFILCLTYDSVINYLTSIEAEPLIINFEGTLLIDQLLVTGNGRNRFITCSFNKGKVNISTAKNTSPDDSYKKLTIDLLKQHYSLLHNSILSDKEKDNIMNGILF